MFDVHKVIWSEGMFLEPQHFQQAERSLLGVLAARVAAMSPYGCGLTHLRIDDDAVGNGRLALCACGGVLPDGEVFDCPDTDPLPPARAFGEFFGSHRQSLDAYLALPVCAEGCANVQLEEKVVTRPARHIAHTATIYDDAAGTGTKEVTVGVKNLSILFDGEPMDGYTTLRIARLVRKANAQPAIEKKHVPPCLCLSAAPWVAESLRGVIDLMQARIHALSQSRRQRSGGVATFAGHDELSFRLLQVLNTSLPLLMHFQQTDRLHPRELYGALLQLSGSLCTFTTDFAVADIGSYDHEQLYATFEPLYTVIRTVVGADFGAVCRRFALESVAPALYAATIDDHRVFDDSCLFLGVKASGGAKELILSILQRAKLSSRERLDMLIAAAMPGVQLVHVPSPPERLAAKPSHVYFALGQHGDMWDGIRRSGKIGLYLPLEDDSVTMELLALRNE